jgi:hypothetical protein
MAYLILLAYLLTAQAAQAAVPGGSDGPTAIFAQWGASNTENFYYLPDTWLGGDICTVIPDRRAYLAKLAARGVTCNGQWCNGNFGTNNRREDYEMEHIIDRNGVTSCPTNILGNLVMAYGRWNNQVGQLNPQGVAREKTQVYGNIYRFAYFNVGFCCVFNSIGQSSGLTIFLVTLGLIFLVVMAAVGYSQWRRSYQPTELTSSLIVNDQLEGEVDGELEGCDGTAIEMTTLASSDSDDTNDDINDDNDADNHIGNRSVD